MRFNLQELMIEKGISGNGLAKAIDERPATLHDLIENRDMDSRRIPARIIAKLCDYFDITPNELISIVKVDDDQENEKLNEDIKKE